MNWIDDKYKEKLGNKKFPDSLKEAGWAKAEKLLDKEMPVSSGGGMGITGKYLIALLAIVAIPAAVWYFSQTSELPADGKTNTDPALITNDDPGILDQKLDAPIVQDGNTLKLDDDADLAIEIEQTKGEVNQEPIGASPNKNKVSVQSEQSSGDLVPSTQTPSIVDDPAIAIQASSKNTEQNNGTVGSLTDTRDGESSLQNDPNVSDLGSKNQSPDPIHKNSDPNPEENVLNNKQDKDASNGDGDTPTKDAAQPDPNESEPKEDADIKDSQSSELVDSQNPNPISDELGDDENLNSKENNPQVAEVSDANKTKDEAPKDPNEPENTGDEKPQANESDVTNKDDDSMSSNSVKKKRKEHLAFLDLPDEEAIADEYQFFSRERFSLSMWGGYTYTDKFLSASNFAYSDKRQAEEKAIWTTPTGVDLDYYLDGRWTLGIGFRWTEYGEDLQYSLVNRDTAWIDGRNNNPSNFSNVIAVDSSRIITGINQGHWNYVVVSQSTDSAVLQNNGRTSWQYVEIPLMLGYRFGQGSLRPWIKSGVSFGIPINTTFRYLNPEATQLNDLSLTHSKLVAPLQYNYLLDVGLDCYITRNFSIRLNATSSIQLNSSLRQSAIKQRYYRLGLGLGIAYNF